MATQQRSIRMPQELDAQIERERQRHRGMGWTEQVVELLDEAIRMRRCPGIVFRDGPTGRRAVVEGSGVDVWTVIQEWMAVEEDWLLLQDSFPGLSELQLRAALSYYALYGDAVDERLQIEEEWTAERVASELPFAQGLPG